MAASSRLRASGDTLEIESEVRARRERLDYGQVSSGQGTALGFNMCSGCCSRLHSMLPRSGAAGLV